MQWRQVCGSRLSVCDSSSPQSSSNHRLSGLKSLNTNERNTHFASRQNPKDLFFFFSKSFPSHERSGHDNSSISPCLVASLCASFNSPGAIDTRRCARRPGDYSSHCREAVRPKKMKSVEISQVGFQTLIRVLTFAVVQRPHWQQNRGARR